MQRNIAIGLGVVFLWIGAPAHAFIAEVWCRAEAPAYIGFGGQVQYHGTVGPTYFLGPYGQEMSGYPLGPGVLGYGHYGYGWSDSPTPQIAYMQALSYAQQYAMASCQSVDGYALGCQLFGPCTQ